MTFRTLIPTATDGELKMLYRELLGMVGEDEPTPKLSDALHMTQALEVKWRNQLRAEQRKRLANFFEQKGEES